MEVISLSPTGNGAHVVHSSIAKHLSNYTSIGYSPWLTLMPPLLYKIGKQRSASLIHAPLDYACFFKREGVPLIATAHNFVLDRFMRQFSSLLQGIHYSTDLKYFTKCSLESATCVTAVSEYTARLVKSELGYNKTIPIIYNGIDECLFKPKRIKNDHHKKKKFKILFSGNLTQRKQFGILPALSRELGSEFEILYTGGLNEHTGFRKTVKGGVDLVNLGSISYEKMPDIYNSVDALFMPSVREGFGLAVAEAMACGLPIVANNSSSIPELTTDNKGGFLCEQGNVSQYVSAFRMLCEDKKLCDEMGGFNRDRIERKFTLHRMISEYQSLFESYNCYKY